MFATSDAFRFLHLGVGLGHQKHWQIPPSVSYPVFITPFPSSSLTMPTTVYAGSSMGKSIEPFAAEVMSFQGCPLGTQPNAMKKAI